MQSQRANRPQSIDEFLRLLDTPITVAPTHEEIIMEESDKTEILAAEKPAPTPKSAPTPASKSTPKENKRSRNSRNKWVILGVLLFGVLGYLLTQKGGDEDYSTEKHISSISSNNLAEERRQQEEQERLAQEEQERQEATERERKRKEDEERKKQESFQPTGYHQNYASVDLGLSVKWATCNVGANRPGDYGNYYAWGETTTKTEYTESNSKTYRLHMKDIGGNLSYDAATANWGGEWRMPSADEAQELLGYCSWTWSSKDGYNGYQVTSKKNGKSIFLPAEGWY